MPDPDPSERSDLSELLRRRALTLDEARPYAVERRHARGGPALGRGRSEDQPPRSSSEILTLRVSGPELMSSS